MVWCKNCCSFVCSCFCKHGNGQNMFDDSQGYWAHVMGILGIAEFSSCHAMPWSFWPGSWCVLFVPVCACLLVEVAKVALCSPRLWDAALEAARRWVAFEPQSLNPRCAEAFAQAGSQVQLRSAAFCWTLMCFDVLCKYTLNLNFLTLRWSEFTL